VKDGVRTHYSNNDKAIRILGYRPKVSMAEGFRRACEDYKRHLAAEAARKEEPKKLR
jgi:sterol-4alpha-carboxylate 3-dehydrogenase (decarboxylating)